jgi:hypothetical protein
LHIDAPVTPAVPAPAPLSPQQTLEAHLDDVMDQAAIAANAQRDEEAGIPFAQPEQQEAQDGESDDDEQEDDADEQEAAPAAQAQEAEAAQPSETPPGEQPKYSRRDAARFAAELEVKAREAAEAREIAQKAQAELTAARASDQHVLTQLAEISGFTVEANGRTKYANLSDKVIRGTATEAERREVAEMTQWHELAKPIYRAAEREVSNAFATDWKALKDLEGVGEAGFEKLNKAPNSVAGARELHAMAYAAGESRARKELETTISRLKAELKSAKLGVVTHAPQPAVANGAAVPGGASFRDRAFNADGTLNEDFDREVRAGKWLGVDLAAH